MKRNVVDRAYAQPFLYKLNREIHVNQAVGLLINAESTGANCPVNSLRSGNLIMDSRVVEIVLM